MIKSFHDLINRDLKIAFYTSSNFLFTGSFFILVVILIPFIFGSDSEQLRTVFKGIIWISVSLSILLTLERIFYSDYEDGSLDLILQKYESLEIIICAKFIAHWIINCLPLIIVLPFLSILFQLTFIDIFPILINLVIGSLGMVFVATFVSALTLGAKRTIFLKGIILIPLLVPFIIFGVDPHSWPILIALSMMSFVVSIYASAYGLRLYGE
tara:strand:- start:616 stop:1251 length:636 start_codon:yes stop_codon:yes gene_type:complete